jgi:hypothetical protein
MRVQCHSRWQNTLDPSINRTPPGCSGKCAEDEDSKLKDAVQTHGAKNWKEIAVLIPVERNVSVGIDGRNTSTLIVVQSREGPSTLKKAPPSGLDRQSP